MHRSYRVPSPTRRGVPPGRSSTGALDSSSSSRETYTSPRASVERVIPISEEKYVNGKLVQRNVADPSYDPHTHRRGTYDAPSSARQAAAPIVHNSTDWPSDSSRSAKLDDYYATPATSSPRHKKTYSVDSDGGARLVDSKSRDTRRLVDLDGPLINRPQRDSRGYNVSSRPTRRSGVEDYAGYEYTNPRDMYETTEPVRQRPRRGSMEATSSRERPIADGFGPPPRASTFRDGPPVTTRGLDRINNGVTRHGSISDGRGRSPQRFRERGSGSFSDDDAFPVAPRMANRGPPSAYRENSRDYYSPVNDRFDDKRQSRASRFEDRDLTQRGFGIRADSVDPPRDRTPSLDRYGPRSSELPPEPMVVRRETMPAEPFGREPAFMIRDVPESAAAPRREHDREREFIPRDSRAGVGQTSATAREYDDDSNSSRRGPREREHQPDRGPFGRYDDDVPPARRERREFDPPERRFTADDAPPPRRDRDRDRDRVRDDDTNSSHHSSLSSLLPGAMAGAAGLYAASKGKQYYDREKQQREDASRDRGDRSRDERQREDRSRDDRYRDEQQQQQRPRNRDDNAGKEERRRDERPPAQPPRPEEREDRDSGKEEQKQQQLRLENPRQETLHDVVGSSPRDKSAAPSPQPVRTEKPAPVRRTSTEESTPRVRHYVNKDTPAAGRSSPPEEQRALTLDADADYKRRMQAELDKAQRPGRQNDSDSDRERQRRSNTARSNDAQPSSHSQESGDDSMAVAPYVAPESDLEEEQDEEGDSTAISERSTGKRVAIVEPPKAKDVPKGILRQPTQKFPEDPNPEREGVAPLKPVPGVPQGVKWTKIDRAKVNPETLEEAHERFEERMDHVIVLRVVDKKQIEKWAARTEEIRTARHEYRHRHDHDKEKDKDRDNRRDRDREHDSRGPERKHRREHRHREGSDDSNS